MFYLITCIISIQPFWGHIHLAELVTDSGANMHEAFRNNPKPVTQDAEPVILTSDDSVDYAFCIVIVYDFSHMSAQFLF